MRERPLEEGDLPDDLHQQLVLLGAVRPRQYSANRSSRSASRSAAVTAIACGSSPSRIRRPPRWPCGRGPRPCVDGMLERWILSLEPGGETPLAASELIEGLPQPERLPSSSSRAAPSIRSTRRWRRSAAKTGRSAVPINRPRVRCRGSVRSIASW